MTNAEQQAFYDTIARYYDGENAEFTDDLAMYSEILPEQGDPILDVGCGSGRVTLHLASEGLHITGIDFSKVMLERGRKFVKGRADLRDLVTFIEGDVLTYKFPQQYKQILLAYNFLMQFKEPEQQKHLIAHLSTFLVDGGQMIFDLPNAGENFSASDDNAVNLERTFVEPETGHTVMQHSVSRIDRAEQIQSITWIYDEIGEGGTLRRTLQPQTLRYVFPTELDLLLELNGLQRIERYGYYDLTPFEDGCERLIVIAQKTSPSKNKAQKNK